MTWLLWQSSIGRDLFRGAPPFSPTHHTGPFTLHGATSAVSVPTLHSSTTHVKTVVVCTCEMATDGWRYGDTIMSYADRVDLISASTSRSELLLWSQSPSNVDIMKRLITQDGTALHSEATGDIVNQLYESNTTRPLTPLAAAWRTQDEDARSLALDHASWPDWVLARFNDVRFSPALTFDEAYSGLHPIHILVEDVMAMLSMGDRTFFRAVLHTGPLLDAFDAVLRGTNTWLPHNIGGRYDIVTHVTRKSTLATTWISGGNYSPSLPTPLLETMPDELLVYVFSFLPPRDYRALATTCRRMWRVGHDLITLRKMLTASNRLPQPEHRPDPVALFVHYTSGSSSPPAPDFRDSLSLPTRVAVGTAFYLATHFPATPEEELLASSVPDFVVEALEDELVRRVRGVEAEAEAEADTVTDTVTDTMSTVGAAITTRMMLAELLEGALFLVQDMPQRRMVLEQQLGGPLASVLPAVHAARAKLPWIDEWIWSWDWMWEAGVVGPEWMLVPDFVALLEESESRLTLAAEGRVMDRRMISVLELWPLVDQVEELSHSDDPDPAVTEKLVSVIGTIGTKVAAAEARMAAFLAACPKMARELEGGSLVDVVGSGEWYGGGGVAGVGLYIHPRLADVIKDVVQGTLFEKRYKLSAGECGSLASLVIRVGELPGIVSRFLKKPDTAQKMSKARLAMFQERIPPLLGLLTLATEFGIDKELNAVLFPLIHRVGLVRSPTGPILADIQAAHDGAVARHGKRRARIEQLPVQLRPIYSGGSRGAVGDVSQVVRRLVRGWIDGTECPTLEHIVGLHALLQGSSRSTQNLVGDLVDKHGVEGFTPAGVQCMIEEVGLLVWFRSDESKVSETVREAIGLPRNRALFLGLQKAAVPPGEIPLVLFLSKLPLAVRYIPESTEQELVNVALAAVVSAAKPALETQNIEGIVAVFAAVEADARMALRFVNASCELKHSAARLEFALADRLSPPLVDVMDEKGLVNRVIQTFDPIVVAELEMVVLETRQTTSCSFWGCSHLAFVDPYHLTRAHCSRHRDSE